MCTDSKTISSSSFFLSFFYIRSTQVSRMPPVVLDLEKPFEVRVELQGSHDDLFNNVWSRLMAKFAWRSVTRAVSWTSSKSKRRTNTSD